MQLEKVLLIWFKGVMVIGMNVDGKVLREKVVVITLSLGMKTFQATGGFIHQFKMRHGLPYKTVSSGKKTSDRGLHERLDGDTLSSLITGYESHVFNTD